MPKKLSSAVVGTLAVGLTLPASVAAAHAAETPNNDGLPQPLTGSGEAAPAAPLASGVNISTGNSAGTFSDPLADQNYTFSTGKGPRCISVQGAFTHHQGQDLVTAEGTPIAAVSDGTVVRTVDGTASRPGFVVVRHNIGGQVYHSGYLHVWDAESHVSVGDSISAGDTIGVVGDSGPTVTPHLHLEIWQGGWHTGTVLDPADWLAERGVDLRDNAQRVQQRDVPASCDYYTAESTKLLSSAGPAADVLAQLPRGAELTSVPGDAENGYVRVTADDQTGWVKHGHLTPDRPADTSADSSTTAPAHSSSSEGQHRVTDPLYARSGPGMDHAIRQGMPTGELITVTATSGDWVQFTRRGEQVWSHSGYLERADETGSSSESSPTTSAEPSQPAAGSGSQSDTREVTTALNVRSGPGTGHGVVGGMPAGEQVSIVSSDGDWVQIRRANGQQGWSHSAYLSGGSSTGSSSPSSGSTPPSNSDADSADSASAGSDAGSADSSDSDSPTSESSDSSGSRATSEGSTSADSTTSEVSDSSGGEDSSTSATVTHTVDEVQLNARSGPGTTHAVVTVLDPDTGLEVTGRNGAWVSFDSAGTTLWVNADYLRGTGEGADPSPEEDSSEPSSSQETSSSGDSDSDSSSSASSTSGAAVSSSSSSPSDSDAASTTAWVNLRSGAGRDHSVQRTVAPDTEIEVLDRSGDWYQVRAGSSTGWIWHDYLDVPESASSSSSSSSNDSSESHAESTQSDSDSSSSSSSSESESSEPSAESTDSDADSAPESSTSAESDSSSSSTSTESSQSSSWSARTTSGVNMRSGAGTDHHVTQVVQGGVRVDVLDEQGGWYQVRTDGSTGWIWRDFLDVSGGPADSSSSESDSSSSDSSDSDSSDSDSSTDSTDSGSSGSSSSGSGSTSGRTGPSSGQHAQSAHGPYSAVWDRLAQCESSGNWSINTGNGYYGGVQFSTQSWEWVGGTGLPSEASKQEQIERAYALWERQGWGAWPSCSAQLSLSGDPGGWGDSYFDVHGGTQSASAFAAAGQWTAGYSVPLREEPSAESEKLVQIPRGAVLDAGERSGSWLQVEFTHDGETLTGWVSTRFITAA